MLAVVAFATPAFADPAPEPAGAEPKLITPTKAPVAESETAGPFSHQGQLELSLRIALGLRALAPYSDTVYCGAVDKTTSTGNAPVCTGRAPFSLDLEFGYGVGRKIDAFLEVRLGLEKDFGSTPATSDGPHIFHVSPGARIFFSEARRTKLFTTGQVVLDFAGYKDAAGLNRSIDFGIRNLNGLWFDLHKAYGLYVFVGETATFVRWLRFELEAGIGIQGRYR